LLLAGGGAAGLNIVPIAHELGCSRVLLPRMAGALSACGAQYTDIVTEFGASQVTQSKNFNYRAVNCTLNGLRQSIEAFIGTLRARGIERFRSEYFVEARYLYQVWELDVPLPGPSLHGATELEALVKDFHAVHESIFAVSETDQEVEFIQWKGRITGELDRPALTPTAISSGTKPAPVRCAPGYFPATGTVSIPIYRGETLRPDDRVEGPALIVEPTTTLVLYPGSSAKVTSFNNYMVNVP
jgi:N-methylhydantoinase A